MGPAISHLLFADDSIFFIRGDVKNLQALKDGVRVQVNGSISKNPQFSLVIIAQSKLKRE